MSSSSSASSSDHHRSESPFEHDDDAADTVDAGSSATSLSGVDAFKAPPSSHHHHHRRAGTHDSDASSATEALLSLHKESQSRTAVDDRDEDRRASWQRLPNVSLAPRLRRKLVADAYSADDDATTQDASEQADGDGDGESTTDDDSAEDMPYAIDVIALHSPATSKAPAMTTATSQSSSPRFKRRPPPPPSLPPLQPPSASAHKMTTTTSKKEQQQQQREVDRTLLSPKLRRKLGHAHEDAPPTSPSERSNSYPAPNAASAPSAAGSDATTSSEDAAQDDFGGLVGAPIGGSAQAQAQARRHRHVPDQMQHIACYFCRRRKIKCGPPAGTDKSCPPCAKRQLPCEYAEKSNRGMRTDLIRKKQSQGVLVAPTTSSPSSYASSLSGSKSPSAAGGDSSSAG